MEVIAFANNNSDEEMNGNLDRDEITTIENFTEDELKLVEIGLKKRHSSEKVRNAMNILRGFQKLASRAEVSAALVSFRTRRQHQNSIFNMFSLLLNFFYS